MKVWPCRKAARVADKGYRCAGLDLVTYILDEFVRVLVYGNDV